LISIPEFLILIFFKNMLASVILLPNSLSPDFMNLVKEFLVIPVKQLAFIKPQPIKAIPMPKFHTAVFLIPANLFPKI
jgi:hypothetical protein